MMDRNKQFEWSNVKVMIDGKEVEGIKQVAYSPEWVSKAFDIIQKAVGDVSVYHLYDNEIEANIFYIDIAPPAIEIIQQIDTALNDFRKLYPAIIIQFNKD